LPMRWGSSFAMLTAVRRGQMISVLHRAGVGIVERVTRRWKDASRVSGGGNMPVTVARRATGTFEVLEALRRQRL